LSHELDQIELLVHARLHEHLEGGPPPDGPSSPEGLDVDLALLAELSGGADLTRDEHLLVLLALAPHLRPDMFGRLIGEHLPDGGDLPGFGGVRGEQHRGVLPTGETAQLVLAGDDLARRLDVQRLFATDHWFGRRHVLWLDTVREGEPVMGGRLILDPEIVERLTTGTVSLPRFSVDFPAEHIDTALGWDDVVLHPDTRRQVDEIEHWIRFNDTLLGVWGMEARVRPGYRALFHGPPGTGKTLIATLVGKDTGRPVFRIDLSRVVSKYIGETEKNLARLFDKAEHKDWILFFDEADALFGKRTEIRDAHDKYANQEVAYLLQRIETHAGLVILATNQRGNVDEAFLRRFQASISFPMPRPEEREALWTQVFPEQLTVAEDVDWHDVAGRFELTGASIVNVAHFCALEALATDTTTVDRSSLETAIRRELVKEGRMI
ncbi:MAG TPA: ATP-binding protein, partial [Iamia sp.]